jgi:chromosome segregation ATPase
LVAKNDENNGRTHEPSLREVTVQLDYLEKLINERDRLYSERWTAQQAAISKAEDSQKTYNQGHNDLSHKMESQYSLMVPAPEAKLKWDSIDKAIEEIRKDAGGARTTDFANLAALRTELMKEISGLRESRSASGGETQRGFRDKEQFNWAIGIAVLIALALINHFWK